MHSTPAFVSIFWLTGKVYWKSQNLLSFLSCPKLAFSDVIKESIHLVQFVKNRLISTGIFLVFLVVHTS